MISWLRVTVLLATERFVCKNGGGDVNSEPHIVLYTHTGCPGGDRAISYFRNRGIPVDVKDIVQDPQARTEFQRCGCFATPVIVIGSRKLIGFDEDEVSAILNREH